MRLVRVDRYNAAKHENGPDEQLSDRNDLPFAVLENNELAIKLLVSVQTDNIRRIHRVQLDNPLLVERAAENNVKMVLL